MVSKKQDENISKNFKLEDVKADKKNPIKDVLHKFKYSFQGYTHCFKNETSFIFETIALVVIIILGLIFKLTFMEWIFSIISLLNIMEVELLNTGIEAVVDMITLEYHPLAKIAKDCGSAATCTATILSLIVNLMIFVPKVLPLILK